MVIIFSGIKKSKTKVATINTPLNTCSFCVQATFKPYVKTLLAPKEEKASVA